MSTTTSYQQLLDALKADTLSPEEQAQLIEELNNLVFRGSMLRLIERMDQPSREEFNALLETEASDEQLQAYITAHVPDAEQAMEDTIAALTSDILAVTTNN